MSHKTKVFVGYAVIGLLCLGILLLAYDYTFYSQSVLYNVLFNGAVMDYMSAMLALMITSIITPISSAGDIIALVIKYATYVFAITAVLDILLGIIGATGLKPLRVIAKIFSFIEVIIHIVLLLFSLIMIVFILIYTVKSAVPFEQVVNKGATVFLFMNIFSLVRVIHCTRVVGA